MQIICKKKFQFTKSTITENASGQFVENVEERLIVSPSPNPQTVPDWIKQDKLFGLAVKDGAILQVATVVDAEDAPAADAEATSTPASLSKPGTSEASNSSTKAQGAPLVSGGWQTPATGSNGLQG